ncbi:CapA family protein [Bifidobacterium platyrrhinorum]|uniref:CapA family protein n=1 Tax=Bifidobacterium platyrrhinorum TaxID=2661628 RepID=A0A6L9SR41_9BIFI|nr:CapA family protein [Bifidobacterium platyrrhinorum]NEG55027.1 CapA family protein [Bifidobacterium platyrrhinorum]
MNHINGHGRHAPLQEKPSRAVIAAAVALVALLAVVLGVGAWAVSTGRLGFGAGPVGGASVSNTASGSALDKAETAPKPAAEHHGNSPDCPDTDCISMLVNGDLLFHEGLWEHFAGPNTSATDGTAFDFDPLFEPMRKYIQASDISVCEFETPIAPRGGPYSAYPIFNIPPEVADAAKHVGYNACTHATNHSWDQGADGIARLWDTLESEGIAQTGSYKTEADSVKPLVIDSPTGGGKLGLVTGTVSLNGMSADQDWQVDRLREDGDPHHDSDIQRAVDKANKAREQGADVVAISMHSVQEYLDDADSWQVSEAHELADTGAFDVIYGAGCHCVQPIEHYNNTWIIYGTGNAVTVTSYIPGNEVNNQGMTARIQFAGKKGVKGSWRVNRIDWLPTANMRQGQYVWCPISSDHPDGTCWNDAEDAKQRQRISDVIYKMGADPNVVREWNITAEQQAKQAQQTGQADQDK